MRDTVSIWFEILRLIRNSPQHISLNISKKNNILTANIESEKHKFTVEDNDFLMFIRDIENKVLLCKNE